MIIRRTALGAMLVLSLAGVAAPQQVMPPFPKEPQLVGLSREEANAIIAKLQDAQEKLRTRASPPLSFELLSGSWASQPMAEIPPRDAFLQLKSETLFSIERRSDSKVRQNFKLSFLPEGFGKRVWDVEVVIAPNEQIERLTPLKQGIQAAISRGRTAPSASS